MQDQPCLSSFCIYKQANSVAHPALTPLSAVFVASILIPTCSVLIRFLSFCFTKQGTGEWASLKGHQKWAGGEASWANPCSLTVEGLDKPGTAPVSRLTYFSMPFFVFHMLEIILYIQFWNSFLLNFSTYVLSIATAFLLNILYLWHIPFYLVNR